MERNLQRTGLFNLALLLAGGGVLYGLARYTGSLAGQAAAAFLALGALAAAVSWFQMRLEERERLEKLEFDEAARSPSGSALFYTQEAETFPARRAREQFEKFFVPGFTVVLFLLQGGGAWWFWRWLDKTPAAAALQQPLLAVGVLGLLGLVLFVIGKYSAGLVRLGEQRLLGPGAGFLLLGAYLTVLAAGALVAFEAGALRLDAWLARALAAGLGLLALETLLTLLLEIYRPRVQGRAARLLYDSRLVGLASRPEALFTTAAHALDYQFGFKVSETWFYQFLRRALGWLALAQLAIVLLSTSVVFIEMGEEGLLERFGRQVAGREILGPGFHLKFPWPVDAVHRFRTREVQSFYIGYEKKDAYEHHAEEKTVLWTVAHRKEEFHLLVASRQPADGAATNQPSGKKSPPVSLFAVGIPVQYRIRDLKAWAYHYADAAALLEKIGTREVVRYLVNADAEEFMSTGRFAAGDELRRRLQQRVDELRPPLGVEILFVGLQDVHPPVAVAAAYEKVVGEKQMREAGLLQAQAHAFRTNAQAAAGAFRRTREAEAEKIRKEVGARATVALFTNQVAPFRASPAVYAQRSYLQTLARHGAGSRKYVVATTNTSEVFTLNLEEKIRSDILDVPLPVTRPR